MTLRKRWCALTDSVRRAVEREFAKFDALLKVPRKTDDCIFAIKRDQIGERSKERGIGHLFGLDAAFGAFVPSIKNEPERSEHAVFAVFQITGWRVF